MVVDLQDLLKVKRRRNSKPFQNELFFSTKPLLDVFTLIYLDVGILGV